MRYREYDPERDREAVRRIWREVGWMESGQEQVVDIFSTNGATIVAELDGEAESVVTTSGGTMRYLREDLDIVIVKFVITGHVARRQGLAGRLTAASLATAAADGALVATLGMFDQGYYDKLGFGTGNYETYIAFDPSHLQMSSRARPPQRLTSDDAAAIHASLVNRQRGHGSCTITNPQITRAWLMWNPDSFGLGYYGPAGELTHLLWFEVTSMGAGPYRVQWMSYQTNEQFIELMALIAGLGDQVSLVHIREPGHIQFQDFLRHPQTEMTARTGSKYEVSMRTGASWQLRILNLPGCLEKTRLSCDDLRFNLHLTDPIERYFDDASLWRGIAGDYVVTLGRSSAAEPRADREAAPAAETGTDRAAHGAAEPGAEPGADRAAQPAAAETGADPGADRAAQPGAEPGAALGMDPSLPTLRASVSAFSRMWYGVRPATGLAVTDDLSGPADLLAQLDAAFLLPPPSRDCYF